MPSRTVAAGPTYGTQAPADMQSATFNRTKEIDAQLWAFCASMSR
jgi:hypothetical protein